MGGGGSVFQGDGSSRGMSVPGDGSSRRMSDPGDGSSRGDECSRGWEFQGGGG